MILLEVLRVLGHSLLLFLPLTISGLTLLGYMVGVKIGLFERD